VRLTGWTAVIHDLARSLVLAKPDNRSALRSRPDALRSRPCRLGLQPGNLPGGPPVVPLAATLVSVPEKRPCLLSRAV